MAQGKFLTVFFAHLAVTLVAGLLLVPIGGIFFEVAHPGAGTYFFWGIYGLIGFPLLDATILHIRKGVELGDTLGDFVFVLVPINSAVVACVVLGAQRVWRRVRLRRMGKAGE